MGAMKKFWQAKYLGGWPEYHKQKNVNLFLEPNGIVAKTWFLNKQLFVIPWDSIVEVGQELRTIQEQSAMGSLTQGLGMIGVASNGNPSPLAGLSLQLMGQNQKTNKTEHYFEVKYNVTGVTGLASFELKSSIFNKRPVLQLISQINDYRIKLKKAA